MSGNLWHLGTGDTPMQRCCVGNVEGEIMVVNKFRELQVRLALAVVREDGMSTAEYAIGTIAAAAFGAVLYTVVTGDSIVSALTNIIDKALNTAV